MSPTASPEPARSRLRAPKGVIIALCCGVFGACDVASESSSATWAIEPVVDEHARFPRTGPLVVQFDRRLSPASVDRAAVRLTSGSVGEFVFPVFDPIQRQLLLEFGRPLLVDTAYVLHLDRLVDLDGAELAPVRRFVLVAGEGQPAPPVDVDPGVALSLLRTRCASADCHDGESRAAGLALENHEQIATTAVGVQSPQVASPSGPRGATPAGLGDLPVIDASGTPAAVARSYLVYKLLGDPRILGEVMPPPDSGPTLTDIEIGEIARWIAAGTPAE